MPPPDVVKKPEPSQVDSAMNMETRISGSVSLPEERLVDAAWAQFAELRSSSQTRGSDAARIRHDEPPTPFSGAFSGYRIISEVHRGGQGVVYQAWQESTRRKVAIKVLREGPLADATELARFEREVDVLSRLKHPNIVTIHDRGQASGFSYLVMDFIAGSALDEYLAGQGKHISLVQRLRLFLKICDAVNAAHLRGIIHRDLKPGNIRIDEDGEPRVLDFGLAKVDLNTHTGSSDAATLTPDHLTHSGQFVGSLPWASPEQAAGNVDQIDLRTDVYSLGVILFQVLTGCFPYQVVGPITQVLHNIEHVEPTRPRSIQRGLDDEVETVVLKCLSKEPLRRYQSAGELARDIERYLNGEPIEAKRDSGWYVLRKNLKRHRAATISAAAFILLLMASAVVAFILYGQAEYQRKQAREALRTAQNQAARAVSVEEFLNSMLAQVHPDNGRSEDPALLLRVLDEASQRIPAHLAGQYEAQASVYTTLGCTYKELEKYDQAEKHLQAALDVARELNRPGTFVLADARVELGDVARLRGNLDQAEQLLRQAIADYQPTDAHTRQHAFALEALGSVREARGDHEEALKLYRHAKDINSTRCDLEKGVGRDLTNIGSLLGDLGKYAEAEENLRRAVEVNRGNYGPDSKHVAESLHLLGMTLGQQGKYSESRDVIEQALAIQRRLLGGESSEIGFTLTTLGTLCMKLKKFEDAEKNYRESLRILQASLGEDHAMTAETMSSLGNALCMQGRHEEARRYIEEALSRLKGRLGERSLPVARSLTNLGYVLIQTREFDAAEAALKQAFEIRRGILTPNHPDVEESRQALIILYEKWEKPERAQAVREQAP